MARSRCSKPGCASLCDAVLPPGSSAGSGSPRATLPSEPISGRFRRRATGARLRRLGPRKLGALVLAYLSLWAVRLGLRRIPFARSRNWLARIGPLTSFRLPALPFCWAIEALSRRLPWSTCLIQAAAGRLLLALSGTPSRVVIGVRQQDGEFRAHAWLESGGRILLGWRPLERFQVIDAVGQAGPCEEPAFDRVPPAEPSTLCSGERLGYFLARYRWNEAQASLAAGWDADALPWEGILRYLQQSGLFPMARRNLRHYGIRAPEPVREALETLFVRNALAQHLQHEEGERLLRRLRAEGIPCVRFKGPELARRLYGSEQLRCSSDIDLFVPPESLSRARAICRSSGYRSPLDPVPTGILLESDTECGFVRKQGCLSYQLEIHWAFLWNASIEKTALAAFHDEVLLPGSWSLDWLYLGLAASAARDGWRNPKLLLDLQEVALLPGFDRARARALAARFGWERLLTAPSAADYLRLPLPQPLHPLYALLRPVRLLSSLGRNALPKAS